jgi:hypothetical protein
MQNHHGRGRRVVSVLIVAVVSLALGGVAGIYAMRWRGGAGAAADMRELIAIKSEAEALAVGGKLQEAHAKYRELSNRIAGHTIKDPFFWDVFDRARVDQDRIYTMLLDEQWTKKAPELVMPPEPGAPAPPERKTVSRPDDAWSWPHIGTGGGADDPRPMSEQYDAVTASEEQTTDVPGGGVERKSQSLTPPKPNPKPKRGVETENTTDKPADTESAPAEKAADGGPATRETSLTSSAEAPVSPRWIPEDEITDDDIGYALKRGVGNLLSHVKNGQLQAMPGVTGVQYSGRNALVVYALLTAGRATGDPQLDPRGDFLNDMIEKLKADPMKAQGKEPSQPVTYARSIRAAALAIYNRKQDRRTLEADCDWLVRAHVDGAYSYDDSFVGQKSSMLNWDSGRPFGHASNEAIDSAFAVERLCHGLEGVSGGMVPPPSRMARPKSGRVGSSGSRLPPMSQKPLFPPQPRTSTPPPGMGPSTGGGLGKGGGTITGSRTIKRPDLRDGEMPTQFPWDNSNSQYGLLGVWAAAEAGVEVPNSYWEAVQSHWEDCQFKSGQWGYQPQDVDPRYSMTCGGVVSLWVTNDKLVAPKQHGAIGRQPMSDKLAKGMTWLETGDNSVNTPRPNTFYPGYDVFVLERAALACGFKYFGAHNWYPELAARSIKAQLRNGAWGWEDGRSDGIIETAYQVLFLSHGRHPLFMNKLRFDKGEGTTVGGRQLTGYWTNRPRDVANLTRYASRELERPFNWQVVDLEREWYDWLDCPVLFIASHQPPSFKEIDYQKLRLYAEAGGLIVTHADGGAASFNHWVLEELVPKVFPNRKAVIVSETDPIYSLHYDIKRPRPQLYGVSNGSRFLLLHSPTDLATAWQQRADATTPGAFKLGVHLFLYAGGKKQFRNRMDSRYVPPAPPAQHGTVGVARLKYDGGDWNPEPGAWRRFADLFQWEMDVNVPVSEVDLAALDAGTAKVAHLTGTQAVAFTDEQAQSLRKFVEAGGIVLVDPCGGSKAFDNSARKLLEKAFAKEPTTNVEAGHILLGGGTPAAEPLKLRLR